jgi:hypothetical protein
MAKLAASGERVSLNLKRLIREERDAHCPNREQLPPEGRRTITQWSRDLTDTQRGVLPGISRERNLRSKI